ncbi:hypothetical protein [Spirosoma aerophilum]
MNKNEQLLADLQALMTAVPNLMYDDGTSDSSGEKIEVVRLPWHKVLRWTQEKDGRAEERLNLFVEAQSNSVAAVRLREMLYRKGLISVTRNVNKDVKEDLYILVSFGWWYVGIKTTLIHT